MKFFEALLNTFWQGALFALLAWAALRWLPRINAATRCAVWWPVLAAIVLLPLTHINRSRSVPAPAPASAIELEAQPDSFSGVLIPRGVPAATFRPRFQLQPGAWLLALIAIWFAVFLG